MTYFKLIFQENKPQTLGKFLKKQGFSHRAQAHARNLDGLVLVNHKRRLGNWQLTFGDEIIFIPGSEPVNPWLKASEQPVKIVKETPNYLIVNKPAGLLSIPSRYESTDAVVNRLLYYFAKTNQVDAKPHVVTRLDQDTSGLVLVAKNAVTHAQFGKMGKDALVKNYLAVVHGNFSPAQSKGLIDQPIGKIDETVKRYVTKTGRKAQTKYRVMAQTTGASLVKLRLLTGRTHQIRVHMQYLAHPLYGDPLYGYQDGFSRQALHCCYLAFPDPMSGLLTKVELPLAADIKALWTKLKSQN